VISINDEIESILTSLEKNLEETNRVTERYQKEILYGIITEKYKTQFIKRQRRINALKSPFIKARGVLQGILGENIEEIREEEIIDLSGLEKENRRTKIMMNTLNYRESIEYYKDTSKHGLNKANKIWRKKTNR
jgi:hypothetical protein